MKVRELTPSQRRKLAQVLDFYARKKMKDDAARKEKIDAIVKAARPSIWQRIKNFFHGNI